MKDPHICKDQKKLARRLRKEPWGKVVMELGMEPYHTESSARRVAEHAAEQQALIADLVKCVDTLMPGGRHLALSGDDIFLLNDTLIKARRITQ